ncbi:hypothetical protein F1721_33015 [Saccharopolyspora hirsuta]|uniref:Uncharacterized protein n=1 Tax=Saccharopolyspora hirsuta TaxID=1837 RepID=A0A5M7BAP4_SACHI|nr:hypothetical protein F1721_33015 [Saccharopolyspora hirsuta]
MILRRNRRLSVLSLLSRLGFQHHSYIWTVPCRDARGRRAQLTVGLVPDGVALATSTHGPITLTPLQAGRLRAAVREAVYIRARLATPGTRVRQHDTANPVYGAFFEFEPTSMNGAGNTGDQTTLDNEQGNIHEPGASESPGNLAERSRQRQAA